MSVAVSLRGLRKEFGPVTAVDGVDLDIDDGEFFSMLGPSGSGKTTVLRMVAGFERPTAGQILLGGDDVTDRPPFARDVNTVFQDYALFPHMNVLQNVEYGLRVKKVPRAECRARANDALETVRLSGFGDRGPHQLSGGQRQRVALARALVNRPRVLLLDEPLGALDLKLRREMQIELKQMQRELGITFVFVTHDQEEALTMSDRIAVFRDGRVEQVATPVQIYEQPATPFVAGFVGTSNLLEGDVAQGLVGEPGPVSIRPEKITLLPGRVDGAAGDGVCTATGVVGEVVFLGAATHSVVDLDGGGRLTVLQQNLGSDSTRSPGRRGDPVTLSWQRTHVVPLGPTRSSPASGADRHLIEETS
jgi:putative spermidine/putrescine transport system ATP-binding protein